MIETFSDRLDTLTVTGELIGFTDLGGVNEDIYLLQPHHKLADGVATHILSFMVRGIFQKVNFPVAHYPTNGVKASQLYPIVWEVIRACTRIGLKVSTSVYTLQDNPTMTMCNTGKTCNVHFVRLLA